MNKKTMFLVILLVIIIVSIIVIINKNTSSKTIEKSENSVSVKEVEPTFNKDDLVKKIGKQLILKLDNGEEKILEDILAQENDITEGYVTKFTFDKLYKDINVYGIKVDYYEGGSYLLISKKNGEEINVLKKLVISPNMERIATYNLDLETGDNGNGFEVIKLENDHFITEIKFNPLELTPQEIWGVSKITWLNNSELEIEKSVMDGSKIPTTGLSGETLAGRIYPDDFLKTIGEIRYKLINEKWVEEK